MNKVVFIIPSFKTGGGNRVFIELANILCANYEVEIVYPNNSADINTFALNSQIKLVSIGKKAKHNRAKIFNVLSTLFFLNRLDRNNTLIVTDPLFCLFTYFLKSKSIIRFMQADDYCIFDDGAVLGNGIVLNVYKKLCLWSYKFKNIRFVFNSKFVYKQFLLYSSRVDIPLKIVHPALNHSLFFEKENLVHSSSSVNICLVARKHPLKGLDTFIEVYSILPTDILEKVDNVFLISHDDLSSYNLQDMQVMKPNSDQDVASIYRKSDIFISTSWWEGFGLPPLEAMACGCSVITSRSGGVNEFAIENHNCLMFEPRNVNELKTCLIDLILNSDRRLELSENGIKTSRMFSWDKSAEQFLTAINTH